MVPQKKPAPDVFLLAAEHLGLSPSACIVIGDSPADVFAAAAAGMDVYLIPDQVPVNEKASAISCCVLTEIGQLPSVLEGRLDCMID